MIKFSSIILIICVGTQNTWGKFSDHLKNLQTADLEDYYLDFDDYEELYKAYVISHKSKAGSLPNRSLVNLTNRHSFGTDGDIWEVPGYSHITNSNVINILNEREYTTSSKNQRDGTNPRKNNNPLIHIKISPLVRIITAHETDSYTSSDEDSYSEGSTSTGSYTNSSDESSSTWDDSDSTSDSDDTSDSESTSDRTSSSTDTSDSGSSSCSDCSDETGSSDESDSDNSCDCSSCEDSDSTSGSCSSDDSDSSRFSDYTTDSSTDSSGSNDSEDDSDVTSTEQSDAEDFRSNSNNKRSHKLVNANEIASVRKTRSPNPQESEHVSEDIVAFSDDESIPKLRILNLRTNNTLTEIHEKPLKPAKSLEEIIDEKIEMLIKSSTKMQHRNDETTIDDSSKIFGRLNTDFSSDGTTSPEVIELKAISWNPKFVSNIPILHWTSLKNKAAGYFQNKLVLVVASEDGFHSSYQEVGGVISDLYLIEVWSEEDHSLMDILITAEDARVNWYHFSGEDQLEQLWTWELQDPVSRVVAVGTNRGLKVLLTFQPNIAEDIQQVYSGVYGVEPWSSWWLEQRLSGGVGAAVAEDGSYLALTNTNANSVDFYVYEDSLNKYMIRDVIKSPGSRCVSAFTSGADSFLAVCADRSSLFLVKDGVLERTNVLDYHLESADVFLPLQVDYLRNAVILLVQHNLEHNSHSSVVLEALTWSGKEFQLLTHTPCITSIPDASHGFSCLLEANNNVGIKDAAAVSFGRGVVSLLLTGEEHSPLVFDVSTEVVTLPHPADARATHAVNTIELLYEKFKMQNKQMEVINNKMNAPQQMIGSECRFTSASA